MGGSTWGVQEQGTGPHTFYEPHHTLVQSLAWPAPKPGLGCPEAPAQSFDQLSHVHLSISAAGCVVRGKQTPIL